MTLLGGKKAGGGNKWFVETKEETKESKGAN